MTRSLVRHAILGALATIVLLGGCRAGHIRSGRRVVVMGVDGLDYQLTARLMAEGRLPNFARMARSGRFSALATSTPPQSPVAWSTFITGLDPGQHGIFDFVHRDPQTMEAFLSTSRAVSGTRSLRLGRWQFPLESGHVDLLRHGQTFWEALERRGIETTIIRMPANFPPSGKATRELSGMGAPDMLGTYGTFSFFTSQPAESERSVDGGVIVPVQVADSVVRGAIVGPPNPYLVEAVKTSVEFSVHLDRQSLYAKLIVGNEERVLRVGEWSDWVPVELKLLPLNGLAGACRFYLKQIHPFFELYVSPINIDPLAPALPISWPKSYALELARAGGRFYTQGIPEDTKSLNAGVLSPDEFLEQAHIVMDENIRQYKYVFDRFEDGFLFYYFGHADQVSHMMWRAMDPEHPAHKAEDMRYADVVEGVYAEVDRLAGETLSRLGPDDLLVIMSDHGFTSWRRAFNLNGWLREHGYLAVNDSHAASDPAMFSNVDWSRTRAYGLGLNGLYINTRGREVHGIVDPADRAALALELANRLQMTTDPKTGLPVVSRVFLREDVYRLMPQYEAVAPDLVVGYAKGIRVSAESAVGAVPEDVIGDNVAEWSGDHSMDPMTVPGVLLTSRPLKREALSLQTLAAALLADFGIEEFPTKRDDE